MAAIDFATATARFARNATTTVVHDEDPDPSAIGRA
jgi:hypothetical protein